MGKLGKKLRREAVANPKKAVFLGLGTVVALYFWIPLVWGWIGKSDPAMATVAVQNDAASATVALSPVTQPAETAAKETVPNRTAWPQIVEAMRKDPRTMTAPALTNTRDPFETTLVEVAQTNSVEPSKPEPPKITPTAAGLALTSTIIGPQRSIAQINGKTYSVGQTIEVALDKEASNAVFKLIEVQPRRAVLEASGQRFELMIPEPGSSGKMELLGASRK
jgi:hypothetical protein